MMRIAIVDDSKEMLGEVSQIVRNSLKKMREVEIRTYSQPIGLEYDIKEDLKYDIYILDIEMPGIDGIKLGKFIRSVQEDAFIIFLTSHSKYSIPSFQYDIRACQFILKSQMDTVIPRVLHKISSEWKDHEEQFYIVKTKFRFDRVKQRDIIHIYRSGRNSVLATANHSVQERIPLKTVMELIDNKYFVKIGRGDIVNIEHIESINGYELVLDNGKMLEISRAYVQAVKQTVMHYWDERL